MTTAQNKKRSSYRVYILGETPPDLKERIAALHAAAILNGKSKDIFPRIQNSDLHQGKTSQRRIT